MNTISLCMNLNQLKTLFTFLILLSLSNLVDAQSTAYKLMLNGLYDKDFPLTYIHEKEKIEKAILLDTREKEEFEVSHLQGAQWVGYETFDMKNVAHIPKDSQIVVYCSVGARSQDIGKKLKEAGYLEVSNLYGGIFHWFNEEKPIVKNNGESTLQIHAYNRWWAVWLNRGEKIY